MQPETNNQYHADNVYVSASMLKTLHESPRVFEAKYITRTMPSKSSAAMNIGTAVHCLALEHNAFDDRYVINKFKDRRTKAYKEWASMMFDKEVLTPSEHDTIRRCVDALRSVKLIERLLDTPGDIEQSQRCIDEETGVPVKSRPDKAIHNSKLLLDIKTISMLTDREFSWACQNFGYHVQDAHYTSIASQLSGGKFSMVFAVVETSEPFRARAFVLCDDSRAEGMNDRLRLLSEYQARKESGDWSELGEQELGEVTLPKLRQRFYA